MAQGEEGMDLKFRIFNGTDIGCRTYPSSTSVAIIKQRLVAEWPQDKSAIPMSVADLKIIHAGKVLDDNNTLGGSRIQIGDLPGEVITMHVVVQPPVAKRKAGLSIFRASI
ncbi:hypothetical protein LguiB_000184 [Lonicera macranthoides]